MINMALAMSSLNATSQALLVSINAMTRSTLLNVDSKKKDKKTILHVAFQPSTVHETLHQGSQT
jgi:hypothetical protein